MQPSVCGPTGTNFNPRPPCGGRPSPPASGPAPRYFNPRPPCGGRHMDYRKEAAQELFQSTSSVWRTTLCGQSHDWEIFISIHVLRVEDDQSRRRAWAFRAYFNPRPPCGGRRGRCASCFSIALFQSTSSVWRTTRRPLPVFSSTQFQSTSSVWRTTCEIYDQNTGGKFQSTSSVWRTTRHVYTNVHHMEDFNPRPPCGGRPLCPALPGGARLFQSTSSVWRTTLMPRPAGRGTIISIHVLRVEDDLHYTPR